MRDIFDFGRYKRMVSVITASTLCILMPICAMGHESNEIQYHTSLMDANGLIGKFDNLEESVEAGPNSLEEGRKFLESFIAEINATYRLSLTMADACRLVWENIHILQLDRDLQEIILLISAELESTSSFAIPSDEAQQIERPYLSAQINWFGQIQKTDKNKSGDKPHKIALSLGMERELPSNCYIGAVELFAGTLIFILPIPGAQYVGLAVIGDGGRRVIDGVMQLGEERRADPNYVQPKLGPPFDQPKGPSIGIGTQF